MRRGPFTRSALILLLTCGLALFALSVLLPAYDDGTPDGAIPRGPGPIPCPPSATPVCTICCAASIFRSVGAGAILWTWWAAAL